MAENKQTEHFERTELPAPMVSRKKISVWSILKNCIGKDLSKITMPVVLNEPLSFLQRLCEYMEYAHILNLASHQENAADRMKYIAAFAVSALASNWDRLGKPFNPLLGETYEFEKDGYRVICEQVSHHPPISAFHAESNDFMFYGSINPTIKFCGKSVEIHPDGVLTVEFPRWKETYTWSNINCCVQNIIVGKLWIEQHGVMEIKNHSTGHSAKLTFKSSASTEKDLHRVEGFVKDENGKNIFFLFGKWTTILKCCPFEIYDEYIKQDNNIKEGKSSSASPNATPKKMFSKLNSFKLNSFRSLSIQDSDNYPPLKAENDFLRSESSNSLDILDSTVLWSCNSRPENSSEYYHFTKFAMQLNVMDSKIKSGLLCPTDARLRPDILCLENGDLDGASKEKTRLEEKQRDSRKLQKSTNGKDFCPRWFKKIHSPHTKSDIWCYSGFYWDRNFEDATSIF